MTSESLFAYAAVVLGLAAFVMLGRLIAGPTLAEGDEPGPGGAGEETAVR